MVENISFLSGLLHLNGQLHLPESGGPFPAVVICHGLGSQGANHAEFAEFLANRRWAALTFDFRGHGESDGVMDEGIVADVYAAASCLRSRPEIDLTRIAVRGSSLGGYLALQAAANDATLRAVVAICPAPEDLLLKFFEHPEAWDSLRDEGLAFRAGQDSFVRYLRAHSLAKAAQAIAPRGLLLVHAKGDQSIDYRRTIDLYDLAGDPKHLLLREDGAHGSAQRELAVHEQTVAFLNRLLPPS